MNSVHPVFAPLMAAIAPPKTPRAVYVVAVCIRDTWHSGNDPRRRDGESVVSILASDADRAIATARAIVGLDLSCRYEPGTAVIVDTLPASKHFDGEAIEVDEEVAS